jgi:hypothetical protein
MSSLTLELENVLFHSERRSSWAKKSHEAQTESTRFHVTHSWMEKLYERLISFLPSNNLDIFVSLRSMHRSSFLVLPSFRKSQDEIYFKGGGL